MGHLTSRGPRVLALVAAVMVAGCAPDNSDGVVLADDVPAVDGASALEGGAPANGARLDAGAAVDRPAPIDAPTPLDRPTPIDVPAPLDLGSPPRDVGAPDVPVCPLPPAAARPPAMGPDGADIARAVAGEHPDWLLNSCASSGGDHRYLFEVLRRLRARDPRWGLDRLLGPVTGDVVTYFHGDGCPEGRREVYKVDVIARHCGIPGMHEPPAATWIDRTSEGGVWTLAGFDPTVSHDAGGVDAPAPVDRGVSRPPPPDGSGVVRALAAERPELLRGSCVMMGGNNEFLFEVVRRLRRMDRRWGLNWKRGVVGDMSQDVVDYYYGPASAPVEGSTDVYIFDMIGGHCGPTPSAAWSDVTAVTVMSGTIGRWTLAGRTDL